MQFQFLQFPSLKQPVALAKSLLTDSTDTSSISLPFCVQSLTEIENQHEKAASISKKLACAFIEVARKGERPTSLIPILWPFIIIKQENTALVFDSLGLQKKVFHDGNVDSCQAFNKIILECTPPYLEKEQFFIWLDKNAKVFSNFISINVMEINGCFAEKKSADELVSSMILFETQDDASSTLLPPVIDFDKAQKSLNSIEALRKKSLQDIATLQETKSFLNSLKSKWDSKIFGDIEWTRNYYDKKIAEIRPEVEENIEKLELKRDSELNRLLPQIETRESQVNHWAALERRDQSLVNEAEGEVQRAEEELNLFKRREIEDPDSNWGSLEMFQYRLNNAEEKLRESQVLHSDVEIQFTLSKNNLEDIQADYNGIKNSYNKQIKEQQSRITILDECKREKTEELYNDLTKIGAGIKAIDDNLSNLVNRKTFLIKEINDLFIVLPRNCQQLAFEKFIYVPFFIGRRIRGAAGAIEFVAIPPSRIKRKPKFTHKLGHFFLGTIPSPIEPRNDYFSILPRKLEALILNNKQFRTTINDTSNAFNLLHQQPQLRAIQAGIQELRKEQIISEKSERKLLLMAQHFQQFVTAKAATNTQVTITNPNALPKPSQPKRKIYCKYCGAKIEKNSACPNCGKIIKDTIKVTQEDRLICIFCNTTNKTGAKFCKKCGKKLAIQQA